MATYVQRGGGWNQMDEGFRARKRANRLAAWPANARKEYGLRSKTATRTEEKMLAQRHQRGISARLSAPMSQINRIFGYRLQRLWTVSVVRVLPRRCSKSVIKIRESLATDFAVIIRRLKEAISLVDLSGF